MASHTPGPWRADTDVHGRKDIVAYIRPRESGFLAAVVERNDLMDKTMGGSSEANARLIAAAPELLEALQTLIDLGSHDTVFGEAVRVTKAYAQAVAAVAKAEGK